MSEQTHDPVSRRKFIKAAVAAGLAGAVAGAGAAKLAEEQLGAGSTAVLPPAPQPITRTAPVITNPSAESSEMLQQLAAAQAENMRLQTELDAAQRRIESLEQSGGETSSEVDNLRIQLAEANSQVGVLGGLVALYDQLEEVDWSATIEDGLETVGDAFSELIDDLPTLENGIALGQTALAEFENYLPNLEEGQAWLDEQLTRFEVVYRTVEVMLQNALDRVAPVLEMAVQWFADVLSWLPFGMGAKAEQVMLAMTDLIDETPRTIEGTRAKMMAPLDTWLLKENGEQDSVMVKKLFKPLREEALEPATRTIAKAHKAEEVYTTQLVAETQTAVASYRIIQQLIKSYRVQHGV